MCLYTWPCLLLVFVKRVCIFVFYVCVNPVGVLSISHLACRVTVFVMCAWLCILHAHVHVEGYMEAFVRSRQGGASCEAVYVYEQMRAPQPHSHQSSNYQRKNITGQYGVKLHGWSHWFWGRKTEKNTRLFSKPTRSSFIIWHDNNMANMSTK